MGKDEAPLFIDWFDYETDGSPLFSSWDEYVEANLEYFKYAELDGDSARGYALIEIDESGKPKQILGTLDCYPEGDAEANTYIDEALAEADADAEFAKFEGRYFSTPKKMGAQTAEANTNAGLAAANQIVGYIKEGITKFQVNK